MASYELGRQHSEPNEQPPAEEQPILLAEILDDDGYGPGANTLESIAAEARARLGLPEEPEA
jgi:hypothetical protein